MSDIDTNKLRRLDGGLLLVFRELLRTGRASQAAEKLGLSQPAISHALGRLRDLFDDPLFVRRPHGFEPTRRALALGPQIEALIGLAGEALSPDARFDPTNSTRLFRICAPEFVTSLIGGGLIQRLRAVAAGVSFAVFPLDTDDAVRALRRGEADFAIGHFAGTRPGYVVEPLFDDIWCVAARQGHPTINGVIDEAGWRRTGHVFAWNPAETGIAPKSAPDPDMTHFASVPGWLMALMLVASTDAIATCPRRLALRHAEKLGLQVLDLPMPPETISVSVMRRSGAADEGAAWFLEQVRLAVEA